MTLFAPSHSRYDRVPMVAGGASARAGELVAALGGAAAALLAERLISGLHFLFTAVLQGR